MTDWSNSHPCRHDVERATGTPPMTHDLPCRHDRAAVDGVTLSAFDVERVALRVVQLLDAHAATTADDRKPGDGA